MIGTDGAGHGSAAIFPSRCFKTNKRWYMLTSLVASPRTTSRNRRRVQAEQTKAAGMAKSVREATRCACASCRLRQNPELSPPHLLFRSNEDFDLKNYTREQAFELVQTAFGAHLPVSRIASRNRSVRHCTGEVGTLTCSTTPQRPGLSPYPWCRHAHPSQGHDPHYVHGRRRERSPPEI